MLLSLKQRYDVSIKYKLNGKNKFDNRFSTFLVTNFYLTYIGL